MKCFIILSHIKKASKTSASILYVFIPNFLENNLFFSFIYVLLFGD